MEHRLLLSDIRPPLPSDWTPYAFLVMELKASSPQYFELELHTPQGARSIRFHPFQGAWIRAAVPLSHFREPLKAGFDLASLGNKPRQTFFVNFHKNQGPLDQVSAIGLRIDNPVGQPSVEVRSFQLSKEDPGDAVLDDLPLVDEFGQWISEDWPGKAHSLEELQLRWREEDAGRPASPYRSTPYSGYLDVRLAPTGFFRVEQINGRWWFVDPDGYLFFSTGVDCVAPAGGTRFAGREEIFRELPSYSLRARSPDSSPGTNASFEAWNLYRRYGSDWQQAWIDATLRRMDFWGLNTIANWSDPRLGEAQRKPYVVTMSGWGIENGVMGLPDIYEQGYARRAEEVAEQQVAPHRDDHWLLGYFIANEPAWPEREALVTDTILGGPPSAIQKALKDFLARGDTPERRIAFVHETFQKFLNMVIGAIRKHDPNHLNLGIRFGGTAPEAVIRMASAFDVYSHNIYAYAPEPAFIDRLYQLTGRPVVIGEFHFGAPGRGMDAGLGQTLNQTERGVAYRYYVEQAAAHPALIGTHWFQWWDQPNTGRMDGENYNIGLVDVTDQPYPEMIAALRATHANLFRVHSGQQAPFRQMPKGVGETIRYE